MKSFLACMLTCAALGVQAAPFAGGHAAAGKRLFDQNHCNRCHMSIMGGDGSAIFTRPNHRVTTPRQLVDQMYACSGNAGIVLNEQDEQDLGAYLNQTYYHFK